MKVVHSIPPIADSKKLDGWKDQWSSQDGLDIYSYISDQCHPEQMLLFSKILFPDFVMVGEGVYLERNFTSEIFYNCLECAPGEIPEVERLLNGVKIYSVFEGCDTSVSDSIFLQLCNVVAFAWRMVLKEKFPQKAFCVEVSNSDQNYGPYVTFYQVKP